MGSQDAKRLQAFAETSIEDETPDHVGENSDSAGDESPDNIEDENSEISNEYDVIIGGETKSESFIGEKDSHAAEMLFMSHDKLNLSVDTFFGLCQDSTLLD